MAKGLSQKLGQHSASQFIKIDKIQENVPLQNSRSNINLPAQAQSQKFQDQKGEERPKLLETLIKDSQYENNEMNELLGYILIILGAVVFIFSTYSMIIAKIFMPYTGNRILDWVKDDEHYVFLIPSMIVTIMLFAYWNWVSMKFFRHN